MFRGGFTEHRPGHRDVRPRRPGDEPRRQGQDARRPGRPGRLDRDRARRQGRAAPGDGSRAAAAASRPTCSSTSPPPRCSAPSSWSSWRRPTRRRRRCRPVRSLDAEHVTVEINTVFQQLVDRCSTRSTRRSSTRRSARSRRRSTAAARSSARRSSTSTRCWQDSTRAWPTCQPRHRGRAGADAERLRRCGTGSASTSSRAPRQVSNTIVDQQQNLDAFLVSAIGLADTRQRRGRRQPAGADRRAAPAGADHATAQPVPRVDLAAGSAASFPSRSPRRSTSRRSVVDAGLTLGVERYRYPGDLPKVAAQRRRRLCKELGSARAAGRVPAAVPRRRRRRQPGAVRQPGHPAELRRDSRTGSVRAARRSAAQQPHRSGCRDDRDSVRHSSSSASSRSIMVLLTAFLFFIFGQYRTGSTNELFGGLHRCLAAEAGRHRPGRRHPGRHGQRRLAAARPQGAGRLRRRPQTSS